MKVCPAVDMFKNYFTIRMAHSYEDLRRIFELRYRVFCEEFHFEEEAQCPNQQEADEFDNFSIEAFLIHTVTQETSGCIRLILPNHKSPPLPFERFSDPNYLPDSRATFGEVSRLTVAKNFRRRQWDGHLPSGVTDKSSELGHVGRNFPLPAISMMFTGAALARLFLLDYTFAMMEPKLAYAMKTYGIRFTQVGEITQYHGQRAPYRIDPLEIWQTINPDLKPLLNFIYFKISQQMPKPILYHHIETDNVG